MKTLDEVIKAYEICHASVLSCEGCPYDNGERWRDSDCYMTDALHYLKEHKNQQDFYSDGIKRTTEMIDKCEKTVAEYLAVNNPPLTWDELKTMEGKPVWVEESAENGLWWTYWVIWQHENAALPEKTYGTTWQAYRKERE